MDIRYVSMQAGRNWEDDVGRCFQAGRKWDEDEWEMFPVRT